MSTIVYKYSDASCKIIYPCVTNLLSILTHLVRIYACNSSCKIIYPRVTNLFPVSNYLFAL